MAASNYTINFLNGISTGTVILPVGTYSFISTTIAGYETGSVNEFTITPTTTSLALNITATGQLEVTVVDDLNNPITAGTLQLSNKLGDARYGTAESIVNGSVTFTAVPYTAAGIDTYIAQNDSDTSHDPIAAPQAVTLELPTEDATVLNDRKKITLNFTMTDANYSGITPVTGDLIVNG